MLLWMLVVGCSGSGEVDDGCPAFTGSHPELDEDGFYYASVCPDDDERELGEPLVALDGVRSYTFLEDALDAAAAGSVITVCDVQSTVILEITGSGECLPDVIIEGTGLAAYNASSGDTVRVENATVELAGFSIRGTGAGDAGNAVRAIDSQLTLRGVTITDGEGDDDGGVRAVDSDVIVIDSDIRDTLKIEGGSILVQDSVLIQRGRVFAEGGDVTVMDSEFRDNIGGAFAVEGSGDVLVSGVSIACVDSRRGVKMDGGRVEDTTIEGCAVGVHVDSLVGEIEDVTLNGVATAVVADYGGDAQCLGSTSITGADVGMVSGGFGEGTRVTGCDVSGARIGARTLSGGGLVDVRISGSSEAAIRHTDGRGTFDRVVVQDNHVSDVAPIVMVTASFVGETDPGFLTFTDSDIVDNSTSDTTDRASNGIFVSEGSTLDSVNSAWVNGAIDVVLRIGTPFNAEYISYEVGGVANFSCEASVNGFCE